MIGVFDSGLGGLTALCELAELMPGEDFVYFGDTGRVPYGSKSADTIIRYSEEIMRFLLGFGIRAALVACGTASSAALPTLRPPCPGEQARRGGRGRRPDDEKRACRRHRHLYYSQARRIRAEDKRT